MTRTLYEKIYDNHHSIPRACFGFGCVPSLGGTRPSARGHRVGQRQQ